MNIGPLVKLVLSTSNIGLRLKFQGSDQRIDLGEDKFRSYLYETKLNKVSALNTAFNSLTVLDSLGLRKYARFDRLLDSITVHPAYPSARLSGWVSFLSTSFTPKTKRRYILDQDGTILVWDHRSQEERGAGPLNTLPEQVYSKVLHLCYSSEIVFDLDDRKVHGLNIHMFAVNSLTRHRGLREIFTLGKLTLQISTQELRTDFSNMKALRRWRKDAEEVVLFKSYLAPQDLNLRLKFKTRQTQVPLKALEVNVRDLILLKRQVHNRNLVHFQHESGANATIEPETSTVNFAALRLNCFCLLSWAMVHCPDKHISPCPQIWLNGEGREIRVGYPPDGSGYTEDFTASYAAWSQNFSRSEIANLAAESSDLTNGEYSEGYESWTEPGEITLVDMWTLLRWREPINSMVTPPEHHTRHTRRIVNPYDRSIRR